jgi:hypothetical protein
MSANDETHAETVDEQIKYRAESLRWEEEDKKRAQIESARLLSELTEPFPPEVERVLRKGGTALTYIPVSEVITRMNRIFGVKGWSSEIIKCERDALDPDFIVAHVRLTLATRWGETVQKDGFGGQKIKRTKNGDIVDLGDEFKGAVSDALKKAAQQFGIALYLARSDEALSLEIEQDNIAAAPKVDPAIASLWDRFRESSKSLNAEQKADLGKFWEQYSNGAPKPTLETATMQSMMALIEECARLMFPGSEITHE